MNRLIQLLTILFLIGGCSSDETSNPSLQVDLILSDVFSQESNSFVQGEDIEFVLTITNNTEEATTLNFASSQQYDFYITSSGTEVWRWSDDKVFVQSITSLVVPAGGAIEVTEIWDQTLLGGGNIAIDSYTAVGSFMDQSPTAQFNFTVQ